jgi:hypothetical protein
VAVLIAIVITLGILLGISEARKLYIIEKDLEIEFN